MPITTDLRRGLILGAGAGFSFSLGIMTAGMLLGVGLVGWKRLWRTPLLLLKYHDRLVELGELPGAEEDEADAAGEEKENARQD